MSLTVPALPGALGYPLSTVGYYHVPSGTTSYQFPLVFALPYYGKSRVRMYLSLPISGTSHWSTSVLCYQVPSGTRYFQRLPFPIRGTARHLCPCPFPIWGQVISQQFPLCFMPRLSCVMFVGILPFPNRGHIQYLTCLG